MQTLTVAPYKSVSDGTTTYPPGSSVTVSDIDAGNLIAAGYVLVPGAGFAHRGLSLTGSVQANGTVVCGST